VIEQLATATEAELLAAVVAEEAEQIRSRYRQLAALAELNARNAPGTLGYRGLSSLIAALLRCTVIEARKRAVAVERSSRNTQPPPRLSARVSSVPSMPR